MLIKARTPEESLLPFKPSCNQVHLMHRAKVSKIREGLSLRAPCTWSDASFSATISVASWRPEWYTYGDVTATYPLPVFPGKPVQVPVTDEARKEVPAPAVPALPSPVKAPESPPEPPVHPAPPPEPAKHTTCTHLRMTVMLFVSHLMVLGVI